MGKALRRLLVCDQREDVVKLLSDVIAARAVDNPLAPAALRLSVGDAPPIRRELGLGERDGGHWLPSA